LPADPLLQLDAAVAAARAAPLSRRRAMLAALLLDAEVDRLFAGGDILNHRAALAASSPALRLVLELCAMRPDGPALLTESVEVPLAEYDRLDVQDFMVSLYNGHTVQRVRIAAPDGTRHDVHEVLAAALADLRKFSVELDKANF
jgi:hypothetical protein